MEHVKTSLKRTFTAKRVQRFVAVLVAVSLTAGLFYSRYSSPLKTHAATQIVLTTGFYPGSTWTVPADWNNSNNKIECLGGGGAGFANGSGAAAGGGGGAYAKVTNLTLTPGASVSYQIGAGWTGGNQGSSASPIAADSWFSSATSTLYCQGGALGGTSAGGLAGLAANSVPSASAYSGGAGGAIYQNGFGVGGSGGGGAAGPSGNGKAGGSNDSYAGGGGGGGSGGGSSTNGSAANVNVGGTGGNGAGGSGGGAGSDASISAAAGAGTAGGGGGGGSYDFSNAVYTGFNGANGGNDAVWGTYGSGGGGGGGAGNNFDSVNPATLGGAGGYGAGGGGSGNSDAIGAPGGGGGGQGLLVITYTPADTTPPSPSTASFASSPAAASASSVSMTATTEIDAGSPPVQYYFGYTVSTCGVNAGTGGADSGWQTSTSYTNSSLQPNKCYGYTVRARDSAAIANMTASSSAAVTYTNANVPGTPTFSSPTLTTLTLTNNANGNPSSNPTTNFAVQITATSPTDATWQGKYVNATGNPSSSVVWLTNSQLTGLVLTGLTTGTTYTAQSMAQNQNSISTASSTAGTGTPVDSPPTAPGTPTFSSVGATSLTVSWTTATRAVTYSVERCAGPSCSNFVQIATGIAGTSYNDSGLITTTSYSYRILATNSGGNGPYSGTGQTTTLSDPAAGSAAVVRLKGNIRLKGGDRLK